MRFGQSQKKKVVVGLSGGVDSAVSLLLLKKRGFEPIGLSLKYAAWKSKANLLRENVCCSAESFRLAKKICSQLKAPYYLLDCQQEFRKIVIGYFLKTASRNQTPSPCAICNRQLKFKKLMEFAQKKKIDYLATGHYARIKKDPLTNKYQLLKAKDKGKDQTYFLCLLGQAQLKRLIFPLGNYLKTEVYQLAESHGFDFFKKRPQSQDLCFVAQKSIPAFLRAKLGLAPGEIVDSQGRVIGQHQGLYFYTIGQRRYLNLKNGPWWVIGLNQKKNQLVVTNQKNDPALFSQEAIVKNYSFVSGEAPKQLLRVKAKIRLGHQAASALLYPPQRGKLKIVFQKPQKAVTPGQWAVFYQGKVCLGGGLIVQA